ncbi:MAG: hypothetical protein GX682_06655 [Clostridiaceae bacterium]|nr:hypothetical protein [Clostridiaceae bacterium]
MNKVILIQIIVTVLSILLGTLLHFTYQLSGNNKIVGLFSSINESTWEHLKLSFFPIILLGIIEYFFINKYVNNFSEALMIASTISIILVPILFYTYENIFKKHNYIVNILIFIITVIISQFIKYKIITMQDFSTVTTNILSIFGIVVISIAFIIFTYNPPKLELFRNPLK